MRVVHLGISHGTDDIRILKKECSSLSEAGFQVFYLTSDRHGKNINQIIDGTRIITVENTTNSYSIRKNIIKFMKAQHRVKLNMLNAAMHLNADIYHIHEESLLSVGRKLKKEGKKVIYDSHEDAPRQAYSYFKERYNSFIGKVYEIIFEKYEDYSVKKFDFVIAATPHIGERFKRINKYTVIVNNYPLLSDIKCNNQDFEERQKVVCYAGAVSVLRGIDNIIKAMKNISGEFLLAGDISSVDKERFERLDGWNKTEHMGSLSREYINEMYNRSLAGIVTFLPAPNHSHSQPNKLFEYMAAGIPVICSDFKLWKQIVLENNCGICVDPTNPEMIAEKINYIFSNRRQAKKMGENGMKAVAQKYNWDNEKGKLLDAYTHLAGMKNDGK